MHLAHYMIYTGAEQAGTSLVHNWIGLVRDGVNSLRNILKGGSDFCFGVLLGRDTRRVPLGLDGLVVECIC